MREEVRERREGVREGRREGGREGMREEVRERREGVREGEEENQLTFVPLRFLPCCGGGDSSHPFSSQTYPLWSPAGEPPCHYERESSAG